MKKITLLLMLFVASFAFSQAKTKVITKSKLTIVKKTSKEILALRKKHEKFLANSPFRKTLSLSKSERNSLGIPPNKYYEEEWELTMNPSIGRPTPENLEVVRKDLEEKRAQALLNRTPGDAIDNIWNERGPNNVGGRTRAVMFDPNDASNETVFAGGITGGIWKNTNISNANSVWSRVNMPNNLTVSCIVADPNNSSVFYAGTGESYTQGDTSGDGVWKSSDAGLTWTKVLGGVTGPTTFSSAAPFTVNSPADVSGNYATIPTTGFGPTLTTAITANLVLVNDGTVIPSLACSPPLVNSGPTSLVGKIALIRRGSCAFVIKVKAAQDAGAVAVIVMNNVTGTPQAMGGSDPAITIPSYAISIIDGDILEAAVNGGPVSVTLNPSLPGQFSGNLVPGIQTVNDIKIKNNGGISELYVAVGDTFNSGAYVGSTTYGVYKSSNAGSTWSLLNMPLTAGGFKHCPNDIAIGADGKIWVATTNSTTFSNGGGKIFASSDGGVTFVDKFTISTGKRVQIAASATTADKIYVLSEVAQPPSPASPIVETVMFKTTDGFASNTSIAIPINCVSSTRFNTYGFTGQQAFYDLFIDVDPSNDQTVYIGGIDLFKSTNGCASWTQISESNGSCGAQVHSDQHSIAFGKNANNKIVIGNDGGVFYSSDSGTTISSRNKGYNVTQFYSVGVAPSTAVSGLTGDYFAAGAQDNGTQYFANPGLPPAASLLSQGGDGAHTMFDQGADKYYISNYVYNDNINYKSTAGVTRNINTGDGITSYGAFISIMALDSNKDVLFSDYTTGTTYQIRRYINLKSTTPGLAANKTILTNALLTGQPTALSVSKYTTASSKLLVGTRNSKILLVTSANGTPVWSDLSVGSSFVGSVSDLEFGSSDTQILATFGNYGVVSIWYSNDAGGTWENKEGDLPDIPVKCILKNPLNSEEVIVGTELGVWYTNNFGSVYPNWRQSYNGMSNVKVVDMDIKTDVSTATSYDVYAATFGRGVFSGTFTAPFLAVSDNEIANNAIKVYPTVSKGIVTITSEKVYGNTNLELYDISGRNVYKKVIDLNATSQELNFGTLSSGNYILKLTNEGFNTTKRLIIE